MAKLATILAASLFALVSVVSAENCDKGIEYCGYNLLHKGNYYQEIVAELQKNGQGVDPQHVEQSIFHCGFNGWIGYNTYCHKGCHNGGSGHSDWCQ